MRAGSAGGGARGPGATRQTGSLLLLVVPATDAAGEGINLQRAMTLEEAVAEATGQAGLEGPPRGDDARRAPRGHAQRER
jgi:hypothetical protein